MGIRTIIKWLDDHVSVAILLYFTVMVGVAWAVNEAINVRTAIVGVPAENDILPMYDTSGSAGVRTTTLNLMDMLESALTTYEIHIDNLPTIPLATNSTTTTITDNEATAENNPVVFVPGADQDGGDLGLESDGTFYYTPSTGVVTATGFAGDLTGDVTGDTSGTAGSLAANGANCAAGSYPLGVDASGAIEDCTDATTEITSGIAAIAWSGGDLSGTGLAPQVVEAGVDHDSLSNFVANEHIDWTGDQGATNIHVNNIDLSAVYEPLGVTESDVSDLGTTVYLKTALDATSEIAAIMTWEADVQAILDAANDDAIKALLDTDDIQTLTGIAAGTAHLGTFDQTIITDSSTIKTALQELETELSGVAGGHDPVTIAGGITGLTLSTQELALHAYIEDIAEFTDPNADHILFWDDDAGVFTGLIPAANVLTISGTGITLADHATARTAIGLGTGNSPQFTGIEVGNANDTTITRASAADINVEGNIVYRAGGTDVPIADGGTNSSTALNNDFVIVSSGGAIVESATVTATELALLNGETDLATQAELNAVAALVDTDDEIIAIINASPSTQVGVPGGGSGAATFTDGGILLGSGTGAITALGAAANGQIPIGDGTTDPVLANITEATDALTITNGEGTIVLAAHANLEAIADAEAGVADPAITMYDSSAAAGTADIFGTSTGAYDIIMSLWVDVAGTPTEYMQLDGVAETVNVLKPLDSIPVFLTTSAATYDLDTGDSGIYADVCNMEITLTGATAALALWDDAECRTTGQGKKIHILYRGSTSLSITPGSGDRILPEVAGYSVAADEAIDTTTTGAYIELRGRDGGAYWDVTNISPIAQWEDPSP